MADVERRVRFDELHRRAQRGADRSSLGDDVVFESAREPEARCFLDEHDRKASRLRRCVVACTGPVGRFKHGA
jgi:hypothetical protein